MDYCLGRRSNRLFVCQHHWRQVPLDIQDVVRITRKIIKEAQKGDEDLPGAREEYKALQELIIEVLSDGE